MLECEALAVGGDGAIRDAGTGAPAGTATVSAPLRRLFGAHAPVSIAVREEPDGALVFTVKRGWRFFGRWYQVFDASGAFVGTLLHERGKVFVADRDGKPLAEAVARGPEWAFVTIECDPVATGGLVLRPAPQYAEDPPAKMLLLAANLVALLIELPQLTTGSD